MHYEDYIEKITDEANVSIFARERSRKFNYKIAHPRRAAINEEEHRFTERIFEWIINIP